MQCIKRNHLLVVFQVLTIGVVRRTVLVATRCTSISTVVNRTGTIRAIPTVCVVSGEKINYLTITALDGGNLKKWADK